MKNSLPLLKFLSTFALVLFIASSAHADFWQDSSMIDDPQEKAAFIKTGVATTYDLKAGMRLSVREGLKLSNVEQGVLSDLEGEDLGNDLFCFFQTTAWHEPSQEVNILDYEIASVEASYGISSEDSFAGIQINLKALAKTVKNDVVLKNIICGNKASFGEMPDYPNVLMGAFTQEDLMNLAEGNFEINP